MQIAVIGTGQLGSRHLQSLAKLAVDHSLHAVEPNPASQELARERLGPFAGKVNFHPSVDCLPERIDVAVIATNAAVRRTVLSSLLAHCRVRCLLLEKIIFQSAADCLWAQDFIAEHKVKTWVNFPRRLQSVYRQIRESTLLGQALEIHVTGSRWGLATSAVHFLDLALFLSRASTLSIERLQALTFPSPRHPACLEATGVLTGEATSGQSFSITSWAEGDAPVQVAVESAGHRWIVTERDRQAVTQHASAATAWQWETTTSALHYQSQLTEGVVEEMLATESCGLADFDSALKSHLPFLRAWNHHFAPNTDPDRTSCLVT